MNRAVILKTIREHRLILGLVFLSAMIIAVLVIVALSSAPTNLVTQWLELPLVRNLFRTLLGGDIMNMLNRTGFGAFAFVHPMMLSLVWAFLIVITTGSLTGEIDRGTADLLMSLPVSRLGVYVSISVVVLASGALLAVAPWLGALLCESYGDWDNPIMLGRLALVIVNNLLAIWAVAGVGLAVSAWTSRRGVAASILFGWLLVSFALNFLAALWEPAKPLARLSLMEYFLPLIIVREAELDFGHLTVLGIIAIAGWIIGAVVFVRRDIRTT